MSDTTKPTEAELRWHLDRNREPDTVSVEEAEHAAELFREW